MTYTATTPTYTLTGDNNDYPRLKQPHHADIQRGHR